MKKHVLRGIVLTAICIFGLLVILGLESGDDYIVPIGTEHKQETAGSITSEAVTNLSQTYQNTRYNYSFKYPAGYQVAHTSIENPDNVPITESDGVGLDDGQGVFSGFAVHRLPESSDSLSEYLAQILSDEYSVDTKTVHDNIGYIKIAGLDAYRVECLRNCIPVSSSRIFLELPSGVRFEIVVLNGNDLPEQIFSTLSFEK